MKPIFVDTSALIALGNKRDAFHLPAIRIREELKQTNRHLITTSAVLLEFGNSFSSVALKPTAIKFIEAIRQSNKWSYIEIDDVLLNKRI
jgi:predicted nucleic acid-binding protein